MQTRRLSSLFFSLCAALLATVWSVGLAYAQGVELTLTNGTSPFTLPTGSSLRIDCWQQGGSGYYATGSVPVEASSVRIDVIPGTYNCSLTHSDTLGVTPTSRTLTVSDEQDTSYAATVVYRDAEATISLLDSSSASFAVPAQTYGSITCQTPNSPPLMLTKTLSLGESSAVIRLVSGLAYICDAYLFDNSVSPGFGYASSRTASFVASASTPHTASVTVAPLNAQLSVNLKDSNGNLLPARAMEWVGVSCAAASVSFTASNTVSSGQSSVAISAPAGVAVTCTGNSRVGFLLPAAVTVTSSANQTTDVDISYEAYPQKVQLNLTDESGAFLLPSGKTMSLTCSKPAPDNYFGLVAVEVGTSGAELPVPAGTYMCSLTSISSDLLVNPTWQQNVVVSANQTTNYNATVVQLNAEIDVELVDALGNPFNLPSPGGWVSCQRNSGNQNRSVLISGSNQGSTYVQAGTPYTCTPPDREGYVASAPQTVNVPSNESRTLTFTYTELAQSLTVNLQDKDGNAIPAPSSSASVYCYRVGMGAPWYSRNFVTGSSSRTFAVAAGSYTCSLSNVVGYTALSSKNVTVTEGQNATIAFTVFPLESSVQVNLKDASGNDVPASGWANVWCSASGDGYYFSFSGSFANGESSKSVSVIGGYSYWCNVSSFGNYGGANFSVSVPAGQEVVQNVTLIEKNAFIRAGLVDKTTGQAMNVPVGAGSASVSCYSNSGSGSASATINEGESAVTMRTLPGEYRCSAYLAGFNFPWTDRAVTARSDETVEYQIFGERKDSTVTLNFKNETGEAVAVPANSQWPSVSCWSGEAGSWAQLNEGETSKEIQVVGSKTYSCEVYGFKGYISGRASVAVGAAASVSADVVMRTLDAEITVNLVTGSDSGAPYVVPDGVSASAYCYSDKFSNYGSIAAGSSSVTFKVLGEESYSCSAWVPGLATAPRAGAVAQNGTVAVAVPVINPEVTAMVRLVDPAGNVVETAESVSVGAYSSHDEFYYGTSAPFTNGVATLSVVGNGSYQLYPWSTNYMQAIYGLIKAGDSYYWPTSYGEELLAPASGTVEKDIVLKLADGIVQVSTSNGTQGWAEVRPTSENASSESPGAGGSVSAGGVSVPAPSGSALEVFFWPNSNSALIPKSQTVIPAAGETKNVTFDIIEQNHTIDVTASAPAGVTGYYWCNAFTDTGLTSYGSGAQFGEVSSIGISSAASSSWTVSCQGYSDDDEKRYTGEASYTVSGGTENGSLAIQLSVAGDVVRAKATGSSDTALTVALNTETKLTAEQGTFSSGQTVTVDVRNTGVAPATADIKPEMAYDFTATDSNQATVTAEQNLTFQLSLEAEQQAFNYTATTGYQPAATTDLNQTNQSLALFSLGAGKVRTKSTRIVSVTVAKATFNSGLLVLAKAKKSSDVTPTPTPVATPTPPPDEGAGKPGQIAPAAPQGFKIVKAKKGPSITATWSAAAGATGYEITITRGKKVARKLTVKASAKPSVRLPKLKKGKYTVTLRATNAAGSSAPVTRKLTV